MVEMLHSRPDIRWTDSGSHWRAYGPAQVKPENVQGPYSYVAAGGVDTGVRYSIGPDEISGLTKMVWCEWPKKDFRLEDLQNSDTVPLFFQKCNVCHYADQAKELQVQNQSQAKTMEVLSPSILPARQISSEGLPRLSASDVVLPRYIPIALDLIKKLYLNEFGDAGASILLGMGFDLMSGFFTDPGYKKAMQCVSDEMVHGVAAKCEADPAYISQVKKGLGAFYKAYQADGKILDAVKKSTTRPIDSILKDAGIEVEVNQKKTTRVGVRRTGPSGPLLHID